MLARVLDRYGQLWEQICARGNLRVKDWRGAFLAYLILSQRIPGHDLIATDIIVDGEHPEWYLDIALTMEIKVVLDHSIVPVSRVADYSRRHELFRWGSLSVIFRIWTGSAGYQLRYNTVEVVYVTRSAPTALIIYL